MNKNHNLQKPTNKNRDILFIICLILTCACLRGPIASVGSLITLMEADIHVSKSAMGFITTMPLIVFAASSLFIPRLSKKFGMTAAIIIGMFILAIGSIVRTLDGYILILFGTLLLGVGISTGNVLVPAIIKDKIPAKIGVATGIYLCSQNIFAAIGAGVSYPIANGLEFGWRNTLAIWGVMGVLAMIFWMGFRRVDSDVRVSEAGVTNSLSLRGLLRSKLAWCITVIMGAQSINYYCITAWLPSILTESGMDINTAGIYASLFQLLAIPATFLTPMIIANTKNKVTPVVVSGLLYVVSILMLMFLHDFVSTVIALFLLASGGGASFAWVVSMIAVITSDSAEASSLSAMTQGVGYFMAAIGPTLAGALYDATGTWNSVLLMIVAIAVVIILFGFMSGRMRKL